MRPGETTREQLLGKADWQAAFTAERKIQLPGEPRQAAFLREYALKPWRSVAVIIADGKVQAIDFLPPENANYVPAQLAKVMQLGELAPLEEIPPPARFGLGEDPLPEMLSSASHCALFFLDKVDDGMARTARIRLYHPRPEHSEQRTEPAAPDAEVSAAARQVAMVRAAAEEGNVGAMHRLAGMYANGRGVRRDVPEAVRWYRAAAEGGNVAAMFELAQRHRKGDGVARDDTEAIRWYRAAAARGERAAMSTLGGMYYFGGRGVDRDKTEAVRWYRAAARLGDKHAQAQLERLGLTW